MHRRHHDAVLQLDAPDRHRRKQQRSRHFWFPRTTFLDLSGATPADAAGFIV
jgi:hypothetical protein